MEKKKEKTVKELVKTFDKIIQKKEERQDSSELFKKLIKTAATKPAPKSR